MIKYLRYLIVAVFVSLMGYWAFSIYDTYSQHTAAALRIEKYAPAPMAMVEPKGSGEASSQPVPPPPPQVNKVKVLGIVELELSQATTWTTILQILAIILGSAIGIRIINTTFKKFEKA